MSQVRHAAGPFRVTSVSDIAGRVSAASTNADHLTEATVYLPTGALKTLRRKIPTGFPKWRDASDLEVGFMVDFIESEALSVCAGSIDKETEAWSTFWQQACETHKHVARIEGSAPGFLKAATTIKFQLFARASAAGLGQAIASGAIPRDHRGRLQIEETVILDNEIDGSANQEALVDIWRAINDHQPFSNSVGLVRKARSLQLTTEQHEPLLLLADYAAGIVHAAKSRADTLARSRVSARSASKSYERLHRSSRFIDFSTEIELRYSNIYREVLEVAKPT